MVSTSMVYGCIIDVFNTENISAECSGEKPPSRPRIPCVYGLEVGVGGGLGCWEYVSRSLFRGFAAKGAPLWGEWRMWLLQWLVPFAVSRFARKARYFGMGGERGCCGN